MKDHCSQLSGSHASTLVFCCLALVAGAGFAANPGGMTLRWDPPVVTKGEAVTVTVVYDGASEGTWFDVEGLQEIRGWHQFNGWCGDPCLVDNEIQSYEDCCFHLYCLTCAWGPGHEYNVNWYGPPSVEYRAIGCDEARITAHYYGGQHEGPWQTEQYVIPIANHDQADFTTDPPDLSFCAGETVRFIDTTCGQNILSSSWYFPSGPIGNPGPFHRDQLEIVFSNPGSYTVVHTVTTTTGTSDVASAFEVVEDCPYVWGQVDWVDVAGTGLSYPVGGAKIRSSASGRSTTTQRNGAYVLHLKPGDHSISAEAPGFIPPAPVAVSLVDEEAEQVDFDLFSDGTSLFDLREALGWDSPLVAEPVHPATGSLVYRKELLTLPGPGIPFSFTVYYNSRDTASDGPLGYGWTHSYNISLNDLGAEAEIRWGDGRVERFSYDSGSGDYSALRGHSQTTLSTRSPEGWTAELPGGYGFDFDGFGRLVRLFDRNGNQVTLSHSSQLDQIVDTAGRTVSLHYTGGRLSSVTGPWRAGNSAEFQVDGSGDLTTIVDTRGNSWGFSYDASHRMLTEVDAKGITVVSNVYDGDGRVSEQRDADNRLTSFSYSSGNSLQAYQTTVTLPSGRTGHFSYSTAFDLTETEDGAGGLAERRYDDSGRMLAVYDKLGQETSIGYDATHDPTTVTDPRGASWRISYNAERSPTEVVGPSGETLSMAYDGNDNLSSFRDPGGGEYQLAYNGAGQVLSVDTNNGASWAYSYTSEGLLESRTDPEGGVKTLGYDGAGRLVSVENPDGGVWELGYDDNGNTTSITDPLDRVATMAYDANNNRVSETTPFAVGDDAVTTYVYDSWAAPHNRLTTIIDAEGGATTTTYHADGNMITSISDADGVSFGFEYDDANNISAVIDPSSGRRELSYDANGRMISAENALGQLTSFRYDAAGALMEVENPLGEIRRFERDLHGRVQVATDGAGRATRYLYDQRGLPFATLYADGGVESRRYDVLGNLVSLTDAAGRLWHFGYDLANRLISRTDPLGHEESLERDAMGRVVRRLTRAGRETLFAHDLLGRIESVSYGQSNTITFSYDPAGHLEQMSDPLGTTSFSHDKLGRMLSRTDPYGKTMGYAYSPAGRLTTLSYPDGNPLSRDYDSAGRLWKLTDWRGNVTTYSYDAVGRVQRIDLPNGSRSEYEYDAAGRLSSLEHRRSDTTLIAGFSLSRNAAGQLSSVSRSGPPEEAPPDSGSTALHDELNRLLAERGDGVQSNFDYDEDGCLLSKTTAGDTTHYGYDGLGRLISVEGGGSLTTYSYNGLGQRLAVTHDGVTTRWVGDPTRPYCSTDGSGTIQRYFISGHQVLYSLDAAGNIAVYHPDWLGNVVAVSDASEAVVGTVSYSPYGRAAASTGQADGLQFLGTWGGMSDANGLVFLEARYYDPASRRFLTEDPLGLPAGRNLYAYVGGDPVNLIDPLGTEAMGPHGPSAHAYLEEKTEAGFHGEQPREIDIMEGVEKVQYWALNVGGSVLGLLNTTKDLRQVKLIGPVDTAMNAGKLLESGADYTIGNGSGAQVVHDVAATTNSGIALIPGFGQVYGPTVGLYISTADKYSASLYKDEFRKNFQQLSKVGEDEYRKVAGLPKSNSPFEFIYMNTVHHTPVGFLVNLDAEYTERCAVLGDDLSMGELLEAGWERWEQSHENWFPGAE